MKANMKDRHWDVRFDLGLRQLTAEWRAMIDGRYWREDVIAGLTVACIAIPLSLAIALASGVRPEVGLFTAIIAGVVCALFGGTPLAVSGPAAAMAVLVASVVKGYGVAGLLLIGLICGVLQLALGVLGLGKLIRLVPMPVVEGFTAGIGAIILIGQLPRILGLPAPEESHVLDVLTHIADLRHEAQLASVLLAIVTLAIVFGLPRIHPRIPAPLLAVAIPAIGVAAFGLDVPLIGKLPNSLPLPSIPRTPENADWGALLGSAAVVFALASLESLLSSSAVDKLSRRTRHDPDQELIGQGLGNVASALVGGIPVTGVIARSALNVQAGGRTRLSAITHSLTLLATVFLFSGLMARIPIAALAGVLVSVAARMLDPRRLRLIWSVSRTDAAISIITFAVMVGVDLIAGIQWGIAAALFIAAVRLGQTRTQTLKLNSAGAIQLQISGPVTFLSSLKAEKILKQIEQLPRGAHVVLDLSGVASIDATGAEMLVDLVGSMKSRDIDVAVWTTHLGVEQCIAASDRTGIVRPFLARTHQDISRILAKHAGISPRQRLTFGVEHYRRHSLPKHAQLFEELAHKQTPHTLFITCSDSRIHPTLITSTDPGELFIIRNVGNMVPPWNEKSAVSPAAGIEYAVGVLAVSGIIVCGHSRCGAIRALVDPEQIPENLRSVRAWAEVVEARALCRQLPSGVPQDQIARLNVLLQLDHLRGFPLIRERCATDDLSLTGWFFDVPTGEVEEWDTDAQRWAPVGQISTPPRATRASRATERHHVGS